VRLVENPSAPACWSADGDRPDASVTSPQHQRCADCAQNQKGSGQGESRACRFSQRLAVVLENDVAGDVYQLTLPAQSIFGAADNGKMPLQAYAKFLGAHGLPVTTVVTEWPAARSSASMVLPKDPRLRESPRNRMRRPEAAGHREGSRQHRMAKQRKRKPDMTGAGCVMR
jgi:hypothetical protein